MTSVRIALALSALVGSAALAGCGSGEPPPPPNTDELAGRSFGSQDITEAGRPWRLIDGTGLMLTFEQRRDKTTMSWAAGCNSFGASVEIEPGRLAMGSISGTEIGCSAKRQRQDEWLANFFGSDPRWDLDHGQLSLSSADIAIEFVESNDVVPEGRGSAPDLPVGVVRLLGSDEGSVRKVKCGRLGDKWPSSYCSVRLGGGEVRAFLRRRNGWVEHPVGLRR